jgi:hypothetical protein
MAIGLLFLLLSGAARAQAPGSGDFQPDPASVQRHGPAYRFPQAGWIVLHIEGEPYERGYQHGKLLAPEIAAYLRCFAAILGPKAPTEAWHNTRRLVNALFVRRFEKEFLEEMKGIADGATAAGARFDGRPIDLVDIVGLNCWPEIETLDSALEATPTGLEGIRFPHPQPRAKPDPRPEHCSAFAATGPATADGKIVFGHITMFSLYAANFYNVWIDIKPAKGHRVLMCGYPGAMQSGMDYYLNDAGLLIAETTIGQTRFDIKGKTEASRIRQASQYASTIDQAVEILKKDNNGLYTNEWLLGDINTNEIALFELGTHKSKLHRSSKNQWIGGTEGFYWGCNNTKDLELRLETVASVEGRPANIVFHPSERDIAWQKLYHQHKGKIGVEFGKLAFTTPPLAAHPSLDAKFTTSDLAKELKSYALFGPPLGRTWEPTFEQRKQFPEIKPLVSNPWTILHANPPAKSDSKVMAVDLHDSTNKVDASESVSPALLNVPAWHGTILPQSDGDIWLAAAFAEYERYVAKEKAMRAKHDGTLTPANRDALAVDLFAWQTAYRSAVRKIKDVPLTEIKSDLLSDDWYKLAAGKGVLVLHQLRKVLGDQVFAETMDSFGREHAGKKVTTAEFLTHLRAKSRAVSASAVSAIISPLKDSSLDSSGIDGGAFSIGSFLSEQEQSLIVYGSADEVPTNREAAKALQKAVRESWQNITIPIKSDKEVTEAELKSHHLLLIGRPDSNALVERFRKNLPIPFGSRSFVVRGKTYAHPGSAVIAAADNPLNPRFSLVVLAGLSAEATVFAPAKFVQRGSRPAEVLVLPNEGAAQALVIPRQAAELNRK